MRNDIKFSYKSSNTAINLSHLTPDCYIYYSDAKLVVKIFITVNFQAKPLIF